MPKGVLLMSLGVQLLTEETPGAGMQDQKHNDPRLEVARENLRIACALRELSMSEVSRRAGMSRNGLQQFVKGKSVLSFENLLKICDVLDVPLPLVYRRDGMTRANIRLYRLLENMPTHALGEAEDLIRSDRNKQKDAP